MNKIRQYFSTFVLTRGFIIAFLSSAFIYLEYFDLTYRWINTILAITTLYLLLQEGRKVWWWSGVFIGLFWFWWIAISFQHYGMLWAIPIEMTIVSISYGLILWSIATISERISMQYSLIFKILGLLSLSYIHPFGFDWFKLELMFVDSYIGIYKWQFALVLVAIGISIYKRHLAYLWLILLAYQPNISSPKADDSIHLVTTHTTVSDKWNESMHNQQFKELFVQIDRAIKLKKSIVVLPESVFPLYLNYSQKLMNQLKKKSRNITIITGGLYWDGETPRNSTYIFQKGLVTIANKVVLVPFGESNPLPDFLSNWINKVFYNGAVDYKASREVVDYEVDGNIYRNAICFEATSEKLYENSPANMIVISNNGWFSPSIEPTQQKLLLRYYHKKYGTIIYHSINMSDSYVID